MRTMTVAGLVATIALTASACGALGGLNARGPTPTVATSAPANQLTRGPDPTLAGPPNVPSPANPSQLAAPDRLGAPFATRTSVAQGFKVTLQLYPVLRDGATSHVNVAISSTATENDRVLADILGDGRVMPFDAYAADGIELIDGRHAKVYLVASDGHGHCLCTRDLGFVYLSKNPLLISATFAAPPVDITTVDVRIPNFGTVTNVPVR